jgi:hypothetical protein
MVVQQYYSSFVILPFRERLLMKNKWILMIGKIFYVTLFLSEIKGQRQHINIIKRHLIMILILRRISYNYISSKIYIFKWSKEKMSFINYKVIQIFVTCKGEIMVKIDKFIYVMIIFLSLSFIATNSNRKIF